MQSVHCAPAVPQSSSKVPGTQTVPSQQPVGQVVALQTGATQASAAHTRPAAQTAPGPQWHSPSAPQLLARVELQATQGLPAVPQNCSEAAWQVFAEQQPVAQFVAEHAPPAQTPLVQLFGWQPTQAVPAAPQTCLEVPGWQLVVEEQHPAQVVASQTQLPLTQCRFAPQAALVPQRQALVDEQLSAVSGSQAAQVPLALQLKNVRCWMQLVPEQHPVVQVLELQAQAWARQAWPVPQAGALPQAQVPSAAQASALALSQGLQEFPVAAQRSTEVGVQVCPEQQPVWQEDGSQ